MLPGVWKQFCFAVPFGRVGFPLLLTSFPTWWRCVPFVAMHVATAATWSFVTSRLGWGNKEWVASRRDLEKEIKENTETPCAKFWFCSPELWLCAVLQCNYLSSQLRTSWVRWATRELLSRTPGLGTKLLLHCASSCGFIAEKWGSYSCS